MVTKRIEKEQEEEKSIAEPIELLVELMKVKSSIKSNVTEDYTLAFLNKDEREYIAENYQNAEFAKEMIERLAKKGYYYEFDDKKGDWRRDINGTVVRRYLTDQEKLKIITLANRIFEFFMVHPHMIAILNRNKGENFLVKLLGRQQEEEKPVVFGQDDRSILQKIKDKLSSNKEEVYEED